jgi:hypothetical protein
LHGEQLEVSEGEYRAHALTRMEMHAREQAIYAGHRVGWREKLSHAQVQRGVEARKLETELKRAPVSEANRAAMKRRGRDSDSDGESKEGEGEGGSRGLARSASAAAGVSASGGAAATPASSGSNSYLTPSSSDVFLSALERENAAADAAKLHLVNEHTVRIKDMLDAHLPSHLAPGALTASTALASAVAAATGATPSGRRTPGTSSQRRKGSLGAHAHGPRKAAAAAEVAAVPSLSVGLPEADESKDAVGAEVTPPDRPQQQHHLQPPLPTRSLKSSASAPALHTPAGGTTRSSRLSESSRQYSAMERARQSGARWKNANGLHPPNPQSSGVKLIPRLPVHNGLAAEDVVFSPVTGPPALFVDTHTALEIACAHVRFPIFRARHKQMHYLLLSPDANYLLLLLFWYAFLRYFQSEKVEAGTPHIIQSLLQNIGRKYHEFQRYLKIHLALRPDQRLSSWYDQFEGAAVVLSGEEAIKLAEQEAENLTKPKKAAAAAASAAASRGGSAGTTTGGSAAAAASKHLTTVASVSGSKRGSISSQASSSALRLGSSSSNNPMAALDPFTCVPSYPDALFTHEMERSLQPKTRSGVHHQLERFLLLWPFVSSLAVFELLLAFFPESAHFLTDKFRMRLDADFQHLLSGVELSEVTLTQQRAKFLDPSADERRTGATGSVVNTAREGNASGGAQADGEGASNSSATNAASAASTTFESMFAFNSLVNPRAWRGGHKFHEALLDPGHTSAPGSAALLANAKRIGTRKALLSGNSNNGELPHMPLTRHLRLGGVLEQKQTLGFDDETDEEEAEEGNNGNGGERASDDESGWDDESRPTSPSKLLHSPPLSPNAGPGTLSRLNTALPSPSSIGGPGSIGAGFHSPAALARSPSMVITSSRAFVPSGAGAGVAAGAAAQGGAASAASAAHALMMANHAASMGSPGFVSPLASRQSPSATAAAVAAGEAANNAAADAAAQSAHDDRARRRAREKPQKGSLHSTGDWSRDERERRDFLKRMAARHSTLEKAQAKERARNELRASRLTESEEASGDPVAAGFNALYKLQQHQQQQEQQQQQQQQHDSLQPLMLPPPRRGGGAGAGKSRLSESILEEGEPSSSSLRDHTDAASATAAVAVDGGGDGGPLGGAISSAFRSVLGHRIEEVPPTVTLAPSHSAVSLHALERERDRAAHPLSAKRTSVISSGGQRMRSMSYSASTPALLQPPSSSSAAAQGSPSFSRGVSLSHAVSPDRSASPASATGSPFPVSPGLGPRSLSSLARHRPSAISVLGSPMMGPRGRSFSTVLEQQPLTASSQASNPVGEHTQHMRARLQSVQMAMFAPEEDVKMMENASASSGFTASELTLPLQSVLLMEENMRHARQLRPPTVAINVNALSHVTSLALGMRLATPAWGSGQVLKHKAPIPRFQMGEDLGDGFAFVPPRSAAHMDSIAFTDDAAAAERQARLLRDYKQLHALQLEEGLLRTKHGNGNFEHGDAARVVAARKTQQQRQQLQHKQQEQLQLQQAVAAAQAERNSKHVQLAPLQTAITTTSSTPANGLSPVAEAGSPAASSAASAASVTFAAAATPPSVRPAPLVVATPSAHAAPSAVVSAPATTSTTKRKSGPPSSLHKTTKLEVLQSEAARAGGAPTWGSGGQDDPTLFLTPRTKEILGQIENNREKHEAERRERERITREALERAQ